MKSEESDGSRESSNDARDLVISEKAVLGVSATGLPQFIVEGKTSCYER